MFWRFFRNLKPGFFQGLLDTTGFCGNAGGIPLRDPGIPQRESDTDPVHGVGLRRSVGCEN